jgi:REP element-mobilizing transposase RayT
VGAAPLWCSRVRVLTLMRNPLKRYYGQDDLHFVTFSCYRRRPLLGTPHARDCFLTVLDQVRLKKNFLLLGFVVMPEHVHRFLAKLSERQSSGGKKRGRKNVTATAEKVPAVR